MLPDSEAPFIQCLQKFNAVITAMFGQKLQSQYAYSLKAFAICFHELNEKFGAPYTPKVHVVLQHLEEFVAVTGRTFGAYSEQVVETQHHYYESHYSRFLVNPLNHELYKEKLLKSIISYNTLNL